MMLINSSAWNEVINFYCIKSKKTDFETSVDVSLKEYILELIKPIASIRYLNVLNDLGLIFKTITNGKCYFIDYKSFIDSEDLSLDINKLLIAVENKSQKPGFLSGNQIIIDDLQDIMGDRYDLLEFCSGHDFMNTLSIALENVISNKKK